MNVHWVKHELPELEKTLERIPEKERASEFDYLNKI